MLIADRLAKRYGRRLVFRDITFQIAPGQVVGVVGRNGAGKSTLLQIVAGLARPSAGTVRWSTAETNDLTGTALTRQCGLFAPDAPVYRELTALENLDFFARARGHLTRDELLAHLQCFGLESRADDLAGELSSGLRARLQLAVATLRAPAILLLDEPSANLDEAGRAILRSTLQIQRQRGLALLATNDTRDLELCDGRIEL